MTTKINALAAFLLTSAISAADSAMPARERGTTRPEAGQSDLYPSQQALPTPVFEGAGCEDGKDDAR
jgi:hypothetical protein